MDGPCRPGGRAGRVRRQPRPFAGAREPARGRGAWTASVPAPALADLPAGLQEEVAGISAWEAAQRAAMWLHGADLAVPLTVAPALEQQLVSLRPADVEQVWVRLVGTDETDEAFSFRLQVIRRDVSGRLALAGEDEVVVSLLEGGAPLVTGYGHGERGRSADEVAVWSGEGPEGAIAPALLDLPAPVLADGPDGYQVPVDALAALGEVAWQADGSVALVLGDGSRTAALPVAEVGGRPYVQGADLEAAVDGLRLAAQRPIS